MFTSLLLVGVTTLNCQVQPTGPTGPALDIRLAHGTDTEAKTREQLLRLVGEYPVSKWIFTREILIDKDQIPHSHPVLTLHTRHLGQDDQLLSTFVHEEIHWFEEEHPAAKRAAIAELKKLYPVLPVGYPDGAQDEESDYLHIIVCYDEYQAMKDLVGPERAKAVFEFWAGDHYRAIYRIVLEHEEKVGALVHRYHLEP